MTYTGNRFFLLYIVSIFYFSKSFAVTYYVSPTGSSSATGTVQAPLTFTAAIAKSLTAGDSIIVRGGTYSFSSRQNISKSGTSADFLCIVNYPGEVPVLDFRTQAYNSNNQGVLLSGNYVHIKGLIIQGAGDNGMQVTGSNCKIENCIFRWNCDSGLQMKTGSNNLILDCDSYENFDYQTGGTSSPNYGGNADGFADKQYTNTGTNIYKGCRAWKNSDDGWDSYEKIGNTEYDGCWCFSNGPTSYDMTENIRFKTDSATWFYKFKNTSERYVITNYGNGNGFKFGGNYTANIITAKNCVSVENKVKGFDQNNNNGAMILYNCTSYKNQTNYGFSNAGYGTLLIKNSVSLSGVSSNAFKTTSYVQSNNSWSSGFSCTVADFVSLETSQLLSNRKNDGVLPEITLLHLAPTSALIDKGVDVGLMYVGAAPDLGAFEYNPVSAVKTVYSKGDVRIFPNPVNETSALYISTESNTEVTIQLIDVSGRIVKRFNACLTTGENIVALNAGELLRGNYVYSVSGKSFYLIGKFVK
ncbi:MAG: T9SS type A sorting domain-containing protein [Paludibacteraceae bacterium]